MPKHILNYIPNDLRAVEMMSAINMIFLGIILLFFPTLSLLDEYIHRLFWLIILPLLGAIHLKIVIQLADESLFRTLISWAGAIFWCWLGINIVIHGSATEGTLVPFTLGVANFIAFILNAMRFTKTWKDANNE